MSGQPPKLSPLAIKDVMVQREVEHLRRMGSQVSTVEADRYAVKQLERAAQRNADARLAALVKRQRKQRRRSDQTIAEQQAKQGGYKFFQRSPAAPAPNKPKFVSVCSCGGCIQCKREHRVKEVMRLGFAGDQQLAALAWSLVLVAMRAKAQAGDFKDVALGLDRARLVTREIEDIIDRSIPVMGEWR